MRFLKRLVRILVLVILLGGIGVGVLLHLSKRVPVAYAPNLLTDAQRYEMSARVDTQKLPRLLNLASEAQNRENKVLRGQKVDSTTQPAPLTLSFTQDEINSTLWKWSAPYKSDYERYVVDPYVSLQPDSIVLMGTVPDLGVVSAYFEPKLDEKGMLHCDLASLKLGSLPLPEGLISKKRERLENALKSRLPQWQEQAKIDPTGVANSDAKAAALSKLILQLLHHQATPAVIFVQKDAKHTIPVRLTNVSIVKESLTITVQPMDAAERTALLEQIRQHDQPAVAEAPKS